jgi:hypothetical protein
VKAVGAEQQKARDSHIKGRLVISVRDLKFFYIIVSEESGLLVFDVLSLVSGFLGLVGGFCGLVSGFCGLVSGFCGLVSGFCGLVSGVC